MVRPLRIEFPGALYHVCSRGDHCAPIYLDDADRLAWLGLLGEVCERFGFKVYAFCLMSNHYHLLLETAQGSLSRGMRRLNGVYSQLFNRRHQLSGHVFQGRYHAILCDKAEYLLAVARYIVLNPVRAHMVSVPSDWRWSSHRYALNEFTRPAWLEVATLLRHFGNDETAALDAYRKFVEEGVGAPRPFDAVKCQLYLGDLPVLADTDAPLASPDISRAHKQAFTPSLESLFADGKDQSAAVIAAVRSGAYTMEEIACHCGRSRRTIYRILQAAYAASPKAEAPDAP